MFAVQSGDLIAVLKQSNTQKKENGYNKNRNESCTAWAKE